MGKLFKHISDPEIGLHRRLFQLLSAIALCEFILVSAYTVLFGGSTAHIIIMLSGTFLFALTVAFTFKTGKIRIGSAISALIYFLMYPLTFFSSGGMYGGAPAVFAFALIYVYLVTQKWERIVCLSLCVAASGLCYYISLRRPEYLVRHSVPAEHAESLLSVLLVTLLLCALFAFVTEVYKTENRIVQKQKKQIEDLNRSQKRFFSSMSHEIRTPVNAIIGFNEMTLRGDIPDEARENAQNIDTAGKLLLHTVNEILDMSKLETGGMQIFNAEYRTASLISDVVNIIRPRAREKGLDLILRADPALPSLLKGDEVRIKQILLNVLSNAVKYTKKGSVTLSVNSREKDKDSVYMMFDVTDTGLGIREENIPRLFTAFERFDEQNTHAIEGTGLGLFIVKQLTDLMGGDVSVNSEYGKGTSFVIKIPQEVADVSPVGELDLKKAESSKPGYKASFTAPGAKILAVDDTKMNLTVVKKLLRDTLVSLDTAESGEEALEKTAETRYDVILMDHQMPGMDGIECLHAIKSQENGKCRDSRIVCLTANVGAEMQALYLKEGFDGYLEKPVRGKTLEEELARLLPDELKNTLPRE
ncbi:MAG: response regulator [Clostridia bacterium]|nr:response regulator [Clostridia bacterium]